MYNVDKAGAQSCTRVVGVSSLRDRACRAQSLDNIWLLQIYSEWL